METTGFLKYPMPKSVAKALEESIKLAKQHDVLAIHYGQNPLRGSDLLLWTHDVPDGRLTLAEMYGNPIESLYHLGFAEQFDEHSFLLTSKAFDWMAYQEKKALGKWWMRTKDHARDVILAGVTALTVFLTVLQIIEHL